MRRSGSDQPILHAVKCGVDLNETVTPAENARISAAPEVIGGPGGTRWYALGDLTETLPGAVEGSRGHLTIPTLEIYGIGAIG
jgi:hypothetical protein